MGKIAQVVAFMVALYGGYVLGITLFFLTTTGMRPSLAQFAGWRVATMAVGFTLLLFPIIFGPVRSWDRWYLPTFGTGFLGALTYTILLGGIPDLFILQSVMIHFGIWCFAGLLAYLIAKLVAKLIEIRPRSRPYYD